MKCKALLLAGVFAFLGFKGFYDWKVGNDFQVRFTHEEADEAFKHLEGTIVFDENRPENGRLQAFGRSGGNHSAGNSGTGGKVISRSPHRPGVRCSCSLHAGRPLHGTQTIPGC